VARACLRSIGGPKVNTNSMNKHLPDLDNRPLGGGDKRSQGGRVLKKRRASRDAAAKRRNWTEGSAHVQNYGWKGNPASHEWLSNSERGTTREEVS